MRVATWELRKRYGRGFCASAEDRFDVKHARVDLAENGQRVALLDGSHPPRGVVV
jgi:hypothetical protein